jgi:hypothetical protein
MKNNMQIQAESKVKHLELSMIFFMKEVTMVELDDGSNEPLLDGCRMSLKLNLFSGRFFIWDSLCTLDT